MTKEVILKIIDNGKDNIMESFNIDNDSIQRIRDIVNRKYMNSIDAMDTICASNLNSREKMVTYYLIGYATGVINVISTEE